MSEKRQILIVDDEAAMRDGCRQILEREGLSVLEAENGQEALNMLARRAFELVILDIKMPGMDGIEVLRRIQAQHKETPVVVITGYPNIETAVEAMKCGAIDFLPKPFSRDALRLIVSRTLAYGLLQRENRRLRTYVKQATEPVTMIGETPEMKDVFDVIERVAPTDSTVLIMGESGTGKELVARALHQKSRRAMSPLVVVDCATLVGTLFENELFGHAKGSFTGATATTHGRFKAADGGTLFLDEVGCIAMPIQAKLLRVLEQREFMRVGSNLTISVDVRLIAATNMDLAAAVSAGTFREDLFYRLSVVPVVLPPLRRRKQDIPVLAEHFLRLHCERRQKDIAGMPRKAMAMLMSHDWPGNVRELSNAIERAVVLADGQDILPEHLLHYNFARVAPHPAKPSGMLKLAEVEQAHIEQVMRQTEGNKRRAAEVLGIDRKTLWRKLRQYTRAGH